MKLKTVLISSIALMLFGCTQETQNSLSRSLQNWTGTNGVLDIYAGDKLVHKFINIDKLYYLFFNDEGELITQKFGMPTA